MQAPVLKQLEGRDSEGLWLLRLGRWRNALLSPLAIGTSWELVNVLEVLATSLCRDKRAKKLLLGWSCFAVNLEWLVYLSRPTQVEAGPNLKESLILCPLLFLNDAIATLLKLYLKILGFSTEPVTLLLTCFYILTISNNILVFAVYLSSHNLFIRIFLKMYNSSLSCVWLKNLPTSCK